MRRERNRRGEGERLRAEILAVTTRMLERAGTDDGLTLRGVAREVGVSPQSMYLHFANLDQLILAVLADCHGRMGAALDGAADAETDPVERILARGRHTCPGAARTPASTRSCTRDACSRCRSRTRTSCRPVGRSSSRCATTCGPR